MIYYLNVYIIFLSIKRVFLGSCFNNGFFIQNLLYSSLLKTYYIGALLSRVYMS